MAYQDKFDGNTDKVVTLGVAGGPTEIEGYFLGTKTTPDKGYGEGKLHIFKTAEGTVGVWGKTRLNNLLTSDLVGQMVLASFTGMVAPKVKGRRPSYGFSVKHDPENTIDTGNINLSAAAEAEESEEDSSEAEEAVAYAPRAAAKPAPTSPSADRQARVQALLSGKRSA